MNWRTYIVMGGLTAMNLSCLGIEFSSNQHEIDFGEGKRTVLEFSDKNIVIRYGLPEGWRAAGGGSSLELFDPQTPLARASLKVSRAGTNAPDGDTVEGAESSYKRLAYGEIPTGAREVVCTGMDRTAPLLRKGFGTIYQFQYSHQNRRMSVLVAIWNLDPLGSEKLIASIVEPPQKDSEELSPSAQKLLGSLFSWEEISTDAARKSAAASSE